MSIPTVGLVSQIDFLNPACFTPGGTAVTDLSGNGNNWTFTNNAYTYDATFGTITFPVGNAPLTCSKFYSGNTPFTISYWFFWDAANPIAHTFRLGDYALGTNFITFMQQSPSHMSFYIGTNVYNGPQYAETPDGVLLDQQYNNVCVTFDGTTCKTYVNNVNYDTFSATVNQTGSDPVVFNDFVGNPYWLRGLGLANFYDVGLTSGEVTQLYNDGNARFNPPPPPSSNGVGGRQFAQGFNG